MSCVFAAVASAATSLACLNFCEHFLCLVLFCSRYGWFGKFFLLESSIIYIHRIQTEIIYIVKIAVRTVGAGDNERARARARATHNQFENVVCLSLQINVYQSALVTTGSLVCEIMRCQETFRWIRHTNEKYIHLSPSQARAHLDSLCWHFGWAQNALFSAAIFVSEN